MIGRTGCERGLVSFSLVLLILVVSTKLNAAETTFSDELQALDAMRKGLDTPTDQVEAYGNDLLEKYADPGQRALIHFQLAFVHDQSGLKRPDLVEQHGEAALSLRSLDAAKRLQLYIFLCDAKQTMNRVRSKASKLAFHEMRRDATNVCLQGLKESTKYNLPETKPELPLRPPIEIPVGDPNDLEFKRRVVRLQKENEEYERKRDEVRQLQEAWENRRILYDQIVDLYLRQPAANEEMRELAVRVLPDTMVQILLDRFQEKAGLQQQKVEPPDVRGVIATEVYFSGEAREKTATAILTLLASCTASGTASENDWGEASRGKCRLECKFVKPRTVTVSIGRPAKVDVEHLILTLPLSTGRIWGRSGDEYTWFAKYGPELCRPIQELLKDALPVDSP